MAVEIIVTLKNEDGSRTYKHKSLSYDPIIINHPTDKDKYLKPYVDQAIKEWGGDLPDSCKIKISLEYVSLFEPLESPPSPYLEND